MTSTEFVHDWTRGAYEVTQTRRVAKEGEKTPKYCLQFDPKDHTALVFNLRENKVESKVHITGHAPFDSRDPRRYSLRNVDSLEGENMYCWDWCLSLRVVQGVHMMRGKWVIRLRFGDESLLLVGDRIPLW